MDEASSPTTPPMYLDLMLAGYLSLLAAFAVVCKPPYAWTLPHRYFYMWTPHAVSLGRINFLLTYAALFLIPTAVVFVSVRAMAQFWAAARARYVVPGFVAVAGFPLVCAYAAPMPAVLVELGISVFLLIIWIEKRWPTSNFLNLGLLIFHYAFWLFFCVAVLGRATRPIAWWSEWDYFVFVYPIFGLLYSLVWARNVKIRRQLS